MPGPHQGCSSQSVRSPTGCPGVWLKYVQETLYLLHFSLVYTHVGICAENEIRAESRYTAYSHPFFIDMLQIGLSPHFVGHIIYPDFSYIFLPVIQAGYTLIYA